MLLLFVRMRDADEGVIVEEAGDVDDVVEHETLFGERGVGGDAVPLRDDTCVVCCVVEGLESPPSPPPFVETIVGDGALL